jgi:hypothetical protein
MQNDRVPPVDPYENYTGSWASTVDRLSHVEARYAEVRRLALTLASNGGTGEDDLSTVRRLKAEVARLQADNEHLLGILNAASSLASKRVTS